MMYSKRMSAVIPAVIPTSRHELDTALELFSGFSDAAQVDIVDGRFISDAPASWPYTKDAAVADTIGGLRFDTLPVQLDLMLARPEETIEIWKDTLARAIIVHYKSTDDIMRVIAHRRDNHYALGIALHDADDVQEFLSLPHTSIDFVQLMGIREVGTQGQPFDEDVLLRIQTIRDALPDMLIQIDGGVSRETIQKLTLAGADRFVSGSAILSAADPASAYRDLRHRAGDL